MTKYIDKMAVFVIFEYLWFANSSTEFWHYIYHFGHLRNLYDKFCSFWDLSVSTRSSAGFQENSYYKFIDSTKQSVNSRQNGESDIFIFSCDFRTREAASWRVGFDIFFNRCCCSVFRCFGRPKTCLPLFFCSYQKCSCPISPIRRTGGTRRWVGRRIRGAAWRRGLVCLFPWHFSAVCRYSLKIFGLQIKIQKFPKYNYAKNNSVPSFSQNKLTVKKFI